MYGYYGEKFHVNHYYKLKGSRLLPLDPHQMFQIDYHAKGFWLF